MQHQGTEWLKLLSDTSEGRELIKQPGTDLLGGKGKAFVHSCNSRWLSELMNLQHRSIWPHPMITYSCVRVFQTHSERSFNFYWFHNTKGPVAWRMVLFSPLSDTMANLLLFFSSIFLHYEIVQNSTHHQAVVKTKQFVRVKVTFVSKYSHTLYIVEEKLKWIYQVFFLGFC